jgi:hypothetical protein
MATLPTSEIWDLIDYTFRATDPDVSALGSRLLSDATGHITVFSFIQHPNVIVEDGYAHFVAESSTSDASLKQVSSLIMEEEIPGGVPQNFTLEFDIFLSEDLPKLASDANNRLFVGAINLQGFSGGLIFSREGVFLAAHPEDPHPLVLSGTKGLLFKDDGSLVDGVFFRIVVNGEDGRVYLYAETSEAAYYTEKNITDAELIASPAAKEAAAIYNDSVIIYGSGCSVAKQVENNLALDATELSGQDVSFSIGSLRLASGKRFPQDRPTAVVTADKQVVAGHALVLSGLLSSDLKNRPLTYTWEIDFAPEDSRARLQGAGYATCFVSVPVPGEATTTDALAITFEMPSSAYNDYTTVITVASTMAIPLTIGIDTDKKEVLILLESDEDGNSATTVSQVVAAFSDTMAAGYDMKVSGGEDLSTGKKYPRLLHAQFAEESLATGSEYVQPGGFLFQDGVGSSVARPIFIPDVAGTYGISLMVHNGLRWSRKDLGVITATLTEQLLGHRPNSGYIFKYLPDFWNMVKDKDQLSALWSAITQVISSELISTWQNDYAKALRDIARRYQRRWLHYSCSVEIPEYIEAALVMHQPVEHASDPEEADVTPIIAGTHTKTAYIDGTESLPPVKLGKALSYSNIGPPEVLEVTEVAYVPNEVGNAGRWKISSKLTSFPAYRLLEERTGGYFITDPEDVVVTTPVKSAVLFDPTYPLSNIDPEKDVVRLTLKSGDIIIAHVTKFNPGGVKNTVRLDIPREDVDGTARDWDHLRAVQYSTLRQVPYIELPTQFSFGTTTFEIGDYAQLAVVNPYTSTEENMTLPVIAIGGNSVFVQWESLYNALNAAAALNGDERVWGVDDLSELSWKFLSIMKHRETFSKEDLVSIPALGPSTVKPEAKKEKYDYVIEDSRVKFNNLLSGTLTITDGIRVKIDADYEYHPALQAFADISGNTQAAFTVEDLETFGLHTIVLEDGPAGSYRIGGVMENSGELLIDFLSGIHKGTTATKVKFHIPAKSAYLPGSDTYWAELSYFDNSQTIENNFGLFVGFPEELVHSYDENLDYLSVIKSLWFAFLSGPHFDNMKLAVQSLFNLPYAEVESQITYIEEPSDAADGVILLTDKTNRTYTYTYPLGAELAINPATGRLIKPFSIVSEDEEKALTTGQALQLADSKVAAFTKLVDVVSIEDYISDPELIEHQFGGTTKWFVDDDGVVHDVDEPPTIIEKYHKFIVDVPLDVARTTEVFPLVRQFLQEAKPAYTDFILVGSIRFVDEISVVEEPILKPTILLRDTPHTEPFWGLYDGLGKSYSTMLPVLDGEGEQALHPNTGEPLWSMQNETQGVVPPERELLTWPTERTKEKVAKVDNNAIEALAFAHAPVAGFKFKHLDEDLLDFEGNPVANPEGGNVKVQKSGIFVLTIGSSHAYGTVTELLPPVSEFPDAASFHDALSALRVTTCTALGNKIRNAKAIGFYISGDPKFHLILTQNPGECAIPAPVVGTTIVGKKIGFLMSLGGLGGVGSYGGNVNALNDVGIETFYFFDVTPAFLPAPVITYWEDDDVKEKFESGYCEGVLDDYSGDGSWNKKQGSLDMVNSLNSDLDVVNSRVWVPIIKNTAIDAEFELGEEIDILVDGVPVTDCIWNAAPPVLVHYGAGYHPKVPFGVNSPQAEHPNTYMLLGFEATYLMDKVHLTGEETNASPDSLMNYGHESRLDVLETVYDAVTLAGGNVNQISLIGASSGAAALLDELVTGDPIPRRLKENNKPYFLLETMWQADKLINYGPKATADIIITKYIPLGGMDVHAFQDASFNMSPGGGVFHENTFFHERFRGGLEKWETNSNAAGEVRKQFDHPNKTAYVFTGGAPGVDERYLQLKVPVKGPVILSFLLGQGHFEEGNVSGLDMELPDAGEDLVLYYSANNGLTWAVLETYESGEWGDVSGWQEKEVILSSAGDFLLKWEQDTYNISDGDAWAVTDIKIATPSLPETPDSVFYPEWGLPPQVHTSTNITEVNARNSISEVQQHPWNPKAPISEQLVPSFSPGFYSWQHPVTDWADSTEIDLDGGGAITPASAGPLLTWGYDDKGKLSVGNQVELDSFKQQTGAKALQNIHIGYKVHCWKEHHYTHGFTEFFIPAPTLKLIEPSSSAYDIRLGGFYFCNDDPTRTEVPTSDPSSFDGQIGGGYLFFRNSLSGVETPITDWSFEMGTWPGKHIVSKGPLNDGHATWVVGRDPDPNMPMDPGQKSDGHIYELNIPTLPGGEGYYDIIIRNYRPWRMQPGSQVNVHMDEVIAEKAYYYSPGGWGGIAWGTDSWGGGDAF